jgi:hypothetical protein
VEEEVVEEEVVEEEDVDLDKVVVEEEVVDLDKVVVEEEVVDLDMVVTEVKVVAEDKVVTEVVIGAVEAVAEVAVVKGINIVNIHYRYTAIIKVTLPSYNNLLPPFPAKLIIRRSNSDLDFAQHLRDEFRFRNTSNQILFSRWIIRRDSSIASSSIGSTTSDDMISTNQESRNSTF